MTDESSFRHSERSEESQPSAGRGEIPRVARNDEALPPAPHIHRLTPDTIAELLLAAGVAALGALVVYQTTQIRVVPLYAKVGPRIIPYIVGLGLVALGVWLVGEALTGRTARPSTESEDVDPTLPTDWATVGILAVALAVYLLLIERAGFIVASALLFFGAAFAMGSRRYPRDAAIAVVLAVAVFYVFTEGLNLRLPEGWLEVLP